MKKKLSTINITVIMISLVIILVGLFSSIRLNKDTVVSYSDSLYVRDIPADAPIDPEGHVIPDIFQLDLPIDNMYGSDEVYKVSCGGGSCLVSIEGSNYFDPVGKKATITVKASGPDGVMYSLKVTPGFTNTNELYFSMDGGQLVLSGEDLCSATVRNDETFTVTLDNLNDSDFFIELTPVATEYITPGDYSVSYTITIKPDTSFISIQTIAIAGVFLLMAILLILLTVKESKSYDERQLICRGQAAMFSFIVSLVCCFAIGIFSKFAPNFPLSSFESTLIPTFVGLAAFVMLADINDAFVGYNGGRAKCTVLVWILAIVAGLSALAPYVKTGEVNDMTRSAAIFALCFGAVAVEMSIKSIKDRKGALEDEEP